MLDYRWSRAQADETQQHIPTKADRLGARKNLLEPDA
jgi:hypothetical protein